MSEDIDLEMGPVDYLVVEFPGNKMTGEGLPLLVDLVDRGIIRILDFVFVIKETDGSVHALEIADFDGDGAARPGGVRGCVLGAARTRSDLDEAGGVLEPGSSAGVLVYENMWAAPFAGRCGVAVDSWSPVVGSRSRRCWRPRKHWMPRTPRSEHETRERGENDARTYSRSGPDGGHRWYGDRRLQPGLAASGRPVGRSRSSSSTQQQATPQAPPPPAAAAGSGGRVGHGRQAGPAQGAR